ncbi:MAG TPA: glycosyltransferase [Thermomicrobiales bacterium]|nr:glycosyltransferase [Thermomicrobiales bacterium]
MRFVLAVAEHPWPSTSGGQLRTSAIAATLAQLGEVDVISLNMPEPPPLLAPALERYWARRYSQPRRLLDLATGIATAHHVSLNRAIAAGLHIAFADYLTSIHPDTVVLGRPFFGPFIGAARAAGANVIADPDESLVRVSRSVMRSRAPTSLRARAFLDLLSAGRMERRDFRTVNQLWAGSPIEAAALARAADGVPIHIVPNVASRIPDQIAAPWPIRQVAFVGSFGHPPNEEAAMELMRSIMPAIRASGGPEELVLIGRSPHPRLYRLAKATGGVTITGAVDDVDVPLRAAGVLVSPIRSGGGTRLKVLDAAAAGVPIVTTAFGVEGLDLVDGEHMLVAETRDAFARAVRRLQTEAGLVERLTWNAAAFVREHHSRSALRQAIAKALELL